LWWVRESKYVQATGLWAIGVAFFRAERNAAVTQAAVSETQDSLAGNGGGNVVALPTGAARKQAVRALKAAGLSYGEIERAYGVRKGTAHRWCQ
jgi:ribosomal protein S11